MTGSYTALGFDPAPGDTGQGREMATTLRNVTNALEQIKNVVSGTGDQHWEGQTAESFRDLMSEDLKPRIEDAWQSFSTASKALDSWVSDLATFQSRADALEIEAQQARQDISAAQAKLSGMGDKPDDPAKAATFAQNKTANQDALSGKQAVLDDIIARAHTLAGEATDSATTAAGALQTAMDAAPDEPGLWDKITGALEDIGEFLGDCIEYIKDNWWNLLHQLVHICANVLAIASIFFPALAPFALGFAIADTLMSGIDWARGVPGAKEAFLTGAVGLVGGFAVGKAASSFMEVAGPSLATGPFRVMASGAGGASIAAPAAAVLSFNPSFGPALAGFMFLQAKDAKDASDTVTTLLGGNTYYSDSLASGWSKARND